MDDLTFFEPYDDDLFAFNPHALASYLERRGWSVIEAMLRPQGKTYARLCPDSAHVASSIYAGISDRRRWGRQLNQGGWATRTLGQPMGRFAVRLKASPDAPYFVEPIAESMAPLDVTKHLFGRTLSLASTDRPCPEAYGGHYSASCLRLDTDMDDAFLYERADLVLAEIREQRNIAEALRLPFAVFKTGGRGIQTIISLPCSLDTAAASFLSRGFRMALRGRQVERGAKVDRDAFDGLMRLPGGLHCFRNASLFVDVDRERLYPPEEQARLVASCLLPRRGDFEGSPSEEELLGAQTRLAPTLRQVVARDFQVVDDQGVLRVLRAEPNNLLCQMVKRAFEAAGTDIAATLRWRPRERFSAGHPESIYHCDKAWAEEVWRKEILPGEHWHWIHMGGTRGMLAAVVLFGADRALDELKQKAASHRAASPTDAKERIATTEGLWKSFTLKGFVPRKGASVAKAGIIPPDERSEDLARRVAREADARRDSKSRWREEALAAIVAVVVQEMRYGDWEELRFTLSVREIERRVRSAYPRVAMSHVAVNALLKLVARDDTSGGVPLVELLVRVQMAKHAGEASLLFPSGWLAQELLAEAETRSGERPGPPQ